MKLSSPDTYIAKQIHGTVIEFLSRIKINIIRFNIMIMQWSEWKVELKKTCNGADGNIIIIYVLDFIKTYRFYVLCYIKSTSCIRHTNDLTYYICVCQYSIEINYYLLAENLIGFDVSCSPIISLIQSEIHIRFESNQTKTVLYI